MSQQRIQIEMRTMRAAHSAQQLPDPLRQQIHTALLDSGSITTIRDTLEDALVASGWTAELERQVTEWFRNGDCEGYEDAMARIARDVKRGKDRLKSGARTATALEMPREVVLRSLEVTRKEVAKAVDIVMD